MLRRARTFVILCSLFSVLCSPSARAGNLTELLGRETSALVYLETLARKVMQTEERLYDLRRKKKRMDYQVREGQRRISALRKRAGKQRTALRLRIRQLYKVSRGGFARLVLNADDGRNLHSRLSAASLILKRDIREIELYHRELKRHLVEEQRLKRERGHQARLERALLTTLRQQKKARGSQYRILWGIRYNRRARMKINEELSQQQGKLLRRVAYLNVMVGRARGFSRLLGRLSYPVYGSIVGRYGSAVDAGSGVRVLRKGLTFRTYRLGQVRAVARGVVRIAEPMSGYGQLVLMEHAGGFFTVYGFLASSKVKVGQVLYPGNTVGRAGLDPLTGSAALYFEIRRGQHPEDPAPWFRRRHAKPGGKSK